MPEGHKTVVIRRPLSSVFDFVLNGANNKLWHASVLEVRPLGEAPYRAGSKFQQWVKGPVDRIPADYELTEVRPNELIVVEGRSPQHTWTGRYHFASKDDATEVSLDLDHAARRLDLAAAQDVIKQAPADAIDALSQLEKQVVMLLTEGRTEAEIAHTLSVGEGTARNYVYSALSRLAQPHMERAMQDELAALDELKAFLEKHV